MTVTQMHLDAHRWVVSCFDGDYERAIWYLEQCAKSPVDTFYSVKTTNHKSFYTRRNRV